MFRRLATITSIVVLAIMVLTLVLGQALAFPATTGIQVEPAQTPIATPTPTVSMTSTPGATPTATATPTRVWKPAPGFGTRIGVPAIDVGNGWQTILRVQNAGLDFAQAVVDVYPASDADGTLSDDMPVASLCSEPLKPGTFWTWDSKALPSEARSAIVYSVTFDPADPNCEAAINGPRQPGQPLAVVVDRERGAVNEALPVAAAYTGVHVRQSSLRQPFDWAEDKAQDTADAELAYRYYAPHVAVGDAGRATVLILQNMGAESASVTVSYRSEAGDLAPDTQDVPALSPGAAVRLDASESVSAAFAGAAWIQSDQPLAVVVDLWSEDGGRLMTYNALPEPANGAVYHAPLVVRDDDLGTSAAGWDTDVWVQNASPVATTTAQISLQRSSGDTIASLAETVPAGGSWRVPLDDDRLPGSFRAAARIENVLPVVNLRNDAIGQGASFAAVAEGGEVVALPWITRGTPVDSVISIQNLNRNPGETRLRFWVYDARGALDFVDAVLHEGEVWTMNLAEVGYINPGAEFSGLVQVSSSAQAGEPALAAVVAQVYPDDDRGDVTRAYAGVVIPRAAGKASAVYLSLVSRNRTASQAGPSR